MRRIKTKFVKYVFIANEFAPVSMYKAYLDPAIPNIFGSNFAKKSPMKKKRIYKGIKSFLCFTKICHI